MSSIRKHGAKWQARVSRKGHAEMAQSFSSKAAAERWARGVESQFDQGNYVDISEALRTSFTEIIERYRQEVTPHKKGSQAGGISP
jgi:hypothetical protein